jgi:hypothetical protein
MEKNVFSYFGYQDNDREDRSVKSLWLYTLIPPGILGSFDLTSPWLTHYIYFFNDA